jgi:hypothetical protein
MDVLSALARRRDQALVLRLELGPRPATRPRARLEMDREAEPVAPDVVWRETEDWWRAPVPRIECTIAKRGCATPTRC